MPRQSSGISNTLKGRLAESVFGGEPLEKGTRNEFERNKDMRRRERDRQAEEERREKKHGENERYGEALRSPLPCVALLTLSIMHKRKIGPHYRHAAAPRANKPSQLLCKRAPMQIPTRPGRVVQ